MPTLMSLLSTSNIMTSRWQPATKRRDIVELLTVTAHGRFGLHLFWRKKNNTEVSNKINLHLAGKCKIWRWWCTQIVYTLAY